MSPSSTRKAVIPGLFLLILTLCLLLAALTLPAHAANLYYANNAETLKSKLTAARNGDVVILTDDVEISGNITIPAGVTLLVPYDKTDKAIDNYNNIDGLPNANTATDKNNPKSAITAPMDELILTLKLNSGRLDVYGTLVIGGMFSGNQPISGGTYGKHSNLQLEKGATLNVKSGGIVSTYGYIVGGGTVNLEEGGSLYEPFIITDFHGGSYLAVCSGNSNGALFESYAMINVQTNMIINAGADVYGYCSLYASSEKNFYASTFLVISDKDALVNLADGTITTYYSPTDQYPAKSNIGTKTLTIQGDVSMGYLTIDLDSYQLNSSNNFFTLPCNINVIVDNGTLEIPKMTRVAILPGAKVKIRENSNLIVQPSGYLAVLDGMAAKVYSHRSAYSSGTTNQTGTLIVNGTMTINRNAYFGGIVQTETTGSTIVFKGSDSDKNELVFEDGVTSGSHTIKIKNRITNQDETRTFSTIIDNRTTYELTPRIFDAFTETIIQMQRNTTYHGIYAIGDDQQEITTEITSFTYNNGATGTYSSTQTLSGTWADTQDYAIISFNINGGEDGFGKVPSPRIVPKDSEVLLNREMEHNQIVKAGYKFIGWNTAADGLGTPYADDDATTILVSSDTTLYAQWKTIIRTIENPEDPENAKYSDAKYYVDDFNIKVVLDLTMTSDASGYAVLACYNKDTGQMIDCDVKELNDISPSSMLTVKYTKDKGNYMAYLDCTCKLMIVDTDWVPLQVATQFKPYIPEEEA